MSGWLAWVNGTFGGSVDPFDRGLTLGDGVFDTLVAFNGVPFAGARHLARLKSQAGAIGIAVDADRIAEGWAAIFARSGADPVILRTTVTRGRTQRGLWPTAAPDPTLIVTATPWNSGLLGRSTRLVTGTIPRISGSPASRLKTLSYLDNILAAREAVGKGADDALFLNLAGHVACTTIANVFAILGGRLVTPPLGDGVMPGIMRGLVLEAASTAGLQAEERSLTRAELTGAEAAFVTNSVRFLCPVTALDAAPLGSPGHPAIEALLALVAGSVRRECGVDPRSIANPPEERP